MLEPHHRLPMAGQLDIISTVLLSNYYSLRDKSVVCCWIQILYGTASHLPNLLYMKVEEEENNIESATHSSSIQPNSSFVYYSAGCCEEMMTMIAKSHSFIYLFFFSSLPNGRRYGDLPSDKCRQSCTNGNMWHWERTSERRTASGVRVLSENWTVQCKRSRVTHLAHITFPTTGKKSHVNPIGITFTCVLKY